MQKNVLVQDSKKAGNGCVSALCDVKMRLVLARHILIFQIMQTSKRQNLLKLEIC